MNETLYIKQITDTYKPKKDGNIHVRRVEIADTEGKLKVIFNDDYGDLPSVIRKLDEDNDLDAEVEVSIDVLLKSRQTKIDKGFKGSVTLDKEFKGKVKALLDKERIEAEVK